MRRVYKLDKATMEVLAEYRSIVDAARKNAVPLETVSKCCRFRGAGREEYLFRFADDYDENERYRDAQYGRPVLRIDVETGDAEVFGTASKAAEASGVPKKYVYELIRNGKAYCGRYVFDWAR